MKHLEILRTDDIRLYDNWASAPLGALLQMRGGQRIFVGMRTEYPTANGARSAILVLSDNSVGELITDAHLRGAALDISSLVEIVAVNPAPFDSAQVHPLPRGALLKHPKEVYFVWGQLPNNSGDGGVCIASNDPKCQLGACYPHLDTRKLIVIAEKVSLQSIRNQVETELAK